MNIYKCYDILLENGSVIPEGPTVEVGSFDVADPLSRQEHRVAISGALEGVIGDSVESFSYQRISDAS